MKTLACELARLVLARANCVKSNNATWMLRHESALNWYVKNMLPSGSGIDSGCKLNLDKSTPEKLVIETGFHHMNEHGSYTGWTAHVVTVRGSLPYGFVLSISGRDRNMVKEYLYELFGSCLNTLVSAEQETAARVY